MNDELLLDELVETRLINYAVSLLHTTICFPEYQTNCFEFDFKHYIRFCFLNEYAITIFKITDDLSNNDILLLINKSIDNYNSISKEDRKQNFYSLIYKEYQLVFLKEFVEDSAMHEYFEKLYDAYIYNFKNFKVNTAKALDKFNAGLIGTHYIKDAPYKKIFRQRNYESLMHNIETHTKEYPEWAINIYYTIWDYIKKFKVELTDNLISIASEDRIHYLNKIKNEILFLQKKQNASKNDLDAFYVKYNTTEEETLHCKDREANRMHYFINALPPESGLIPDYDKIHPDYYQARKTFLEYHSSQYLQQALDYIDIKFEEYEPKKNEPTTIIQNITSQIPTSNDNTTLNVNHFFDLIENAEITQTEIYNKVQIITDNFEYDKLKRLYNDFELHLSLRQDEIDDTFTDDDLIKEIKSLESQNKEIPKLRETKLYKKADGTIEKITLITSVIDREKLLYPYDLFTLRQFGNFLKEELNKRKNAKNIQPISIKDNINTQPKINEKKAPINKAVNSFTHINYSTAKDSIEDLMNSLIKASLIDKETNKKHFNKIFSGDEIQTPIIWTGNISELCYFVKHLHDKSGKVENLKQKHWKVAINCFKMFDNKPLETRKLSTQKKPSTYEKIEKAIKHL